ncbi:MAG TPA: T9SS type A sorting domain-containing protein [Flavobacteriales bacterium]|nr:T9SS type A sorting domain-containing protein [Flavobacteriales bacterium]
MRGPVRVAIGLLLSCTSTAAVAQIAFGGRPIGLSSLADELVAPALHVLPAVDAAAMMAEDEARWAMGVKGPYRFGFNHTTDVGTDSGGTWSTLRNGDRLWRATFECPNAFAINFQFDRYVVPEGARVFVYNDVGKHLGAYTAMSSGGKHSMGVQPLAGSRITIEYHEPAMVAERGELHIDRVTHAYRDIVNEMRGLGDSGPCNINVICPQGDNWRDQIRSVALVITSNGTCSGALLNNCAQDSTPYFLTANHCLDAGVENWVFRFNWDSPTCDPTADGPQDQTVSGCTQLVANSPTDMLFLELSSIPPADYDVFYSGWDKSGVFPDSVCGIHHPSGDIKKISRSWSTFGQQNIDVGNGPADCWQVTNWDEATTEPGSSGSPLFNQNKMVIGQLYGGSAACGNSVNDYYGRFDVSWPLVESYLGTCGDSLPGLGDGGIVVVPVHFDAAVTSINDIPELICGQGEITPEITLKNNGDVILNSVLITYGIVGGTSYTYQWFGSLQPMQTTNVFLPTIPVNSGAQTLEVSSSLPNNNVDEVDINDRWTYSFTVNNPGGNVQLLLTLDNYGSDITWILTADDDTTVLYSGGPYPDFQEGDVDTVQFCLTSHCYIFTIYDLFGNGICCDEGLGSYMIMADSTVLGESDGQYEAEYETIFCLTVVGIDEAQADRNLEVFPVPAQNTINVRFGGFERVERVQLIDATGRSVFSTGGIDGRSLLQLDADHLANGMYTLIAEDGKGRAVRRVIVQR